MALTLSDEMLALNAALAPTSQTRRDVRTLVLGPSNPEGNNVGLQQADIEQRFDLWPRDFNT